MGACAFGYFIDPKSIFVGLGEKNDLGSFLVADFIFDYFVGSVFKDLVVGVFAVDACFAIKNNLFMVD